MFIFGLHSTSDDRPSDLSYECQAKCKKNEESPPKSSKNKMFVYGLHSTSDDHPSNLNDESQLKWKKNGPLNCQKMKCAFLDYIQLLMIG